jgi:3D (Asp-Asp-Asp) domain-containing protein
VVFVTPLLHWLASLLGTVALTMSVSSYTNDCGAGLGMTYSGTQTRPGVAACPDSLYLRTLYVPGTPERWYTCLDKGSAVTEGFMDLWMEREADALEWGRRDLMVLVLPIPKPQVMPVWPCAGADCDAAERRLR